MSDKKPTVIQSALESQMDRKQFIQYVGATLLAVSGISGIMKAIGIQPRSMTSSNYGGGAYGGKRKF